MPPPCLVLGQFGQRWFCIYVGRPDVVISITLDQFSRARTVWDERGRNQRRHPPKGIFGSSSMAPIYLQLDEVRSSLDL